MCCPFSRDGQQAGIHLILHGQHETPVKIRGEIIPPGFTTYIQLEKQKVSIQNCIYIYLFIYLFIYLLTYLFTFFA